MYKITFSRVNQNSKLPNRSFLASNLKEIPDILDLFADELDKNYPTERVYTFISWIPDDNEEYESLRRFYWTLEDYKKAFLE